MSLRVAGFTMALACISYSLPARPQACCVGASTITPGRLELHERALVGVQLQTSSVVGSYDTRGQFHAAPEETDELDFEQDLLGAVRWLDRGQASILIPLRQSRRSSATTGAEWGGGIGDLNLGARYDIIRNHELSYLPGIGLLVGMTLPTGRPPESSRQPLGSDITGVGTTQISAGVALERTFGNFLVSLGGYASKRLSRRVYGLESELGTQWIGVAGVSYAVLQAAALALIASYSYEGDASVDGRAVAGTEKRQLRTSAAASWSTSDSLRLQTALFLDPPLDDLGRNGTATLGITLGLMWGFR